MIPITRPYTGNEEAAAVAEVIASGWLTQGRRVQAFEEAVAGYAGARQAIATANCTSALHLALLVAGVGPGDEVICPSFSFIATANSIQHAGATPVFVDIDPATYNIDVRLIEPAVTPRTKAVMPVDQMGLAADIPAVLEIAGRHGLKVVEDAAPALGATWGETRIGSLSDFTCFSFHPRKSITTGEGGMVLTNDDAAAARLRRLRSHAASTSDLERHDAGAGEFEEYDELGFNYRMTDLQAAVGVVQMTRLEEILAMRRRLAERYTRLLTDVNGVQPPCEPASARHTYQSYCVRLLTDKPRALVMADMARAGVATRRGAMAIHLQPFYKRRFPDVSLPVTEAADAETMLLPLYTDMTDAEQDTVLEALKAALR